jgi:hypothetical protein
VDSDHTFHLQSRSNLLKSLFLGDGDIDYEIEEYTSSIINIMSKGIYEENWVDRFFINTSTSLLKDEDAKKRILDLDSFKEAEEDIKNVEENYKSLGLVDDKEEEEKRKRKRLGHGPTDWKIPERDAMAFAPKHRWADKHITGTHHTMAAKIPRVTTDKSSYKSHPFSSEIHPLWKMNSSSGYPQFVHMLENYYLSSEDDVPLSQKHGEIEMRHNSHHKKKEGSAVLDNEFLGDLTSLGEGHGALEHSLYERAFNNWMQDNQQDVDKLISEGATDKDIRKTHFKHAADKWIGDDYEEHRALGVGVEKNRLHSDIQNLMGNDSFNNEEDARDYLVEYQNVGKYNQSEIDNYNKEEYDSSGQTTHSHRLGWLGYNLGLEWLSPKERSDVIEHLLEHKSDGKEDNQTHITLDDGVKIPMGRFKRNLIKRAMPEMLWAIGNPDRALPNTSAYSEDKDKDSGQWDYQGKDISLGRINYLNHALTSTSKYVRSDEDEEKWDKHIGDRGNVTNLETSILDKINERIFKNIYSDEEQSLMDAPENLTKLREKYRVNHLPLTKREVSDVKEKYTHKVQEALNGGGFYYDGTTTMLPLKDIQKIDAKILASALKAFSNDKKSAFHSRRNVFHSRGGHEDLKDIYLSDKRADHPLHPIFSDTKENPLLEPIEDTELNKLLEHGMTYADKEKGIRGGMQTFTRIKGPLREHAGDAKTHFDDTAYGLEGLQSYWGHEFQRGGLSITPETYLDFLHNMTSNPDNPEESLFGTKSRSGGIQLHSDMTGLFGMLSHEGLPSEQKSAFNAGQVLSIHNASTPSSLRTRTQTHQQLSRNTKNHNITEHSRVPGLSDKIRHGEVDAPVSKLGYGVADTGFLPNTNHTTKTGSSANVVYDTNIAGNSSTILRDASLRGIGHKPGDKDPATGRTLLGSPVTMYGLNHLFDGTAPLPNVGDEAGLLEFMTQGNMTGQESNQEIETLNEDMGEIIEQLNYAQQQDKQGESHRSLSEAERVTLAEKYTQLEDQKRGIMLSIFNEGYDPANTSVVDNPDFKLLRHIDEKKQDADVIHQIARDHIIPGMKKANPEAFPTDNPSQFLIDSAQALHDAELFMFHSSHDIHGKSGLSLSHRQIEEESVHTKLGHSHHKDIASTTRDSGIPLDGDLTANEILEQLGLGLSNYEASTQTRLNRNGNRVPIGILHNGKRLTSSDWKTHKQHLKNIQEVIDSNKTHVTTLGNILAQRDDSPEGVDNHSSMVEHYDSATSRAATSRGGAYYGEGSTPRTNKSHPLNSDTRRYHQLLGLASDEEMENWGLKYHQLPKNHFGSESLRGTDKNALPNKTKRLMNQLVSYDEGAAPDLDKIGNVGKVNRDEVTHGLVPLNSVRSSEGMDGFAYYSSSAQQMHNGQKMLPASSAMSIDRNGNATWGTKTQSMSLIPASEEGLNTMHGENTISQIQSGVDQQGLDTMFVSPTSNLERVSEESPIPESTNYENIATSFDKIPNSSLLKNLPKEMPLLDPYHKVFDYEDIEELKGFTGDWAVTALEVGDRVKVNRRGTFVEVKSEDGKKVGLADNMRSSIRKLGSKSFTMDGVLNHKGLFMIDLMYYDDTDVTDMDVRERMKLLRSQFDSHENVFVPSPSTLRLTDDEGLEEAIKYLRSENEDCKILIRDAKSTYMKGEDKHPKWILLTKADDDFHVPFSMELDNNVFIINYEHDIVKFDIVDEEPVNPRAIMGELSQSNYTLNLTKSLEKYWRPAFYDMLKEDEDILPEDREEEVEENSGGLLKPKKNSTLILKPNVLKNILEVLERSMDALEKGHTPMSGGKGLGIDVGSDIESPRGPTKLTNEATLPDWDMKERPHQDPEKPEKYPNREKKALETKRSEHLNTGI